MSVKTIRAFVAIELSKEARLTLSKLQGLLRGVRGGASWPRAENMHLTLSFLGDVDSQRVAEISSALERAALSISPFSLAGEGIETKGQRILWLRIGDNEQLIALKEALDRELATLGFEPDKRDFRPHLTLARIRKREEFRRIKALLAPEHQDLSRLLRFEVSSFTFFKSELKPTGAEYTVLKNIIFI